MQAWTGSTSIRDNVAMARGHASDELLPVAPRLTARLQLAPKANRTVVTHTRIESMGPWRPAETMHVALSATLAPSEQSNHASAAIELRQPFRKVLTFLVLSPLNRERHPTRERAKIRPTRLKVFSAQREACYKVFWVLFCASSGDA